MRFSFFGSIRFNVHLDTIFSIRTFEKRILSAAKVRNKSGCKIRRKTRNDIRGQGGLRTAKMVWCKRSIFEKKKNKNQDASKSKKKNRRKKFEKRKNCWLCVLCLCCVWYDILLRARKCGLFCLCRVFIVFVGSC